MNIRSKNKIDPNFQMSSLTDIIFLLLIFFLLTSSLVAINAVQLQLPSSNSSATVKPTASISITSDNQFFFNEDRVEIDELSGILRAFLADSKEAPTVVLNAEQTVAVQEVVKVFDIAKELQISLVLATNPLKN